MSSGDNARLVPCRKGHVINELRRVKSEYSGADEQELQRDEVFRSQQQTLAGMTGARLLPARNASPP